MADFVIFPPRWTVAEHTFRPPYYHRCVDVRSSLESWVELAAWLAWPMRVHVQLFASPTRC